MRANLAGTESVALEVSSTSAASGATVDFVARGAVVEARSPVSQTIVGAWDSHFKLSPATIMCRNVSDGAPCADGWPYAVYHTSDRATGWVDPQTLRLWHETVHENGAGGWQCIETSAASPAACATPFVEAFTGADHYNDHIDLQNVGRELYSFDAVHGTLTCLNLDGNYGAGALCPGQPYSGFEGTDDTFRPLESGIRAVAGKIYVLVNKQINCFDPQTKSACSSMQWPRAGDAQPITAAPSADGVIRNVCTRAVCYALDGTSSTLSSLRFRVLWHAPELCWSASAQAACPSGGGLLSTPLPATAVTSVTASGTIALADQPSIQLQPATREISAPSETSALACGASLSGTLTGPDVPVQGATVELLQIDKEPVLDGADPIVPSSITDQIESDFAGATIDTDEDGSPDRIDLDSDNDGIPDKIETAHDHDGDNVSNYRDLDSDRDGVADRDEGNLQGDDDALPNYLDLDSDNDTIPDSVEQGERAELLDSDQDELPNYLDTDSDDDGIPDAAEAGSNAQYPRDSDGDSIPDYLDADSDDDTIPDAIERCTSATPVDSDQDGSPDYRDTDSDNAGVADQLEAGAEGAAPRNTDSDALPDYLDADSDDDLIPDELERGSGNALADTDGDGKPDMLDDDSDADGLADRKEGSADLDSDNAGSWLDPDSDGDLISDKLESDGDDDADAVPNYLDGDSDNDGVPDAFEAGSDAATPRDTDSDDIPDYLDDDSDKDCLPDRLETSSGLLSATAPSANASDNCTEAGNDRCDTNTGHCTRGCAVDSDCGDLTSGAICDHATHSCAEGCHSDGNQCQDGVVCSASNGAPGKCLVDSDGDAIPDEIEKERGLDPSASDSDGDGISDAIEAVGGVLVDTDRDGSPDALDVDADGDGISDRLEIGTDPLHPRDTDKDGDPDYIDQDGDGDGWPDAVERAGDTDGDGVPDYMGSDSDDDGVSDTDELAWGLAHDRSDSDSDAIHDGHEVGAGPGALDTDGDGRPDAIDLDADNDSLPDQVERGNGELAADSDEDGIPDYRDLDADNDGIADELEARDSRDQITDSDGDGIYDYLDTDSDNDGLSDEAETSADTDADTVPDCRDLDSDNDCLSDQAEAAEQTQLDLSRPGGLASDNCPAEAPICAPRSGLCVTAERAPLRDCTSDNASSVCVSGACDPATNMCVPRGCSSDAACGTGMYCDGDTLTCATQLSAGDKLLADEIHGADCNDELAAKICESGACNPFTNRCAKRDGDSCTQAQECASNACLEGICVSRREVPTVKRLGGGCSALQGVTDDNPWALLSVLGGLGLWLRRPRRRKADSRHGGKA